ncbi:methyltransferase domain-containing protein, partial [Rhizobium johnstonii]|uniref:methyltransferase domain-containing protein n=1 Tax=Rhizobium johnstonii TaxID=3019933 RepID=UPI003F9E478E
THAAALGGVTSILDIGSGGGDLTRQLGRWAARDGLRVRVVGLDPDARAAAFARSRPAVAGVEYEAAFSSELVAAGRRFDLVVSNHMLHHLDGVQLGALLADSERLAPRVIHSDITRSAFAYWGFGLDERHPPQNTAVAAHLAGVDPHASRDGRIG